MSAPTREQAPKRGFIGGGSALRRLIIPLLSVASLILTGCVYLGNGQKELRDVLGIDEHEAEPDVASFDSYMDRSGIYLTRDRLQLVA